MLRCMGSKYSFRNINNAICKRLNNLQYIIKPSIYKHKNDSIALPPCAPSHCPIWSGWGVGGLCVRVSVRFLANPFSGRTISNAGTHTHILHSCGQSADAAASAQTRAPGLCARSELCSLVFGRRDFFCVGLVAGACVPDRVHAECHRNAHTHTHTNYRVVRPPVAVALL